MASKRKVNISTSFLKFFIAVLLITLVGMAIYRKAHDFFMTSPIFQVKIIAVDPSIQFVSSKILNRLVGRNIFSVNLKKVRQELGQQYPQISNLRVQRKFPDTISVVAQRRDPFAVVMLKGKYLLVDKEAVVISMLGQLNPQFPLIRGLDGLKIPIVLGGQLSSQHVHVAIDLIKLYRSSPYFVKLVVSQIDVGNLTKIMLTLNNQAMVIVDRSGLQNQLNVLGMLLSQNRIKWEEVNYIDLRFKEPVVLKKVLDIKE